MKVGLLQLMSDNASPQSVKDANNKLIKDIVDAGKNRIELIEANNAQNYKVLLVFVSGGGTESIFKTVLRDYEGYVFLLATNGNNSLAASMEILSYLHSKGKLGQIIHDANNKIAQKVADVIAMFHTNEYLKTARFGRIGKPSAWLIASDVDAWALEKKSGIKIIDIPIAELIEEINEAQYEEDEYTKKFKALTFDSKEKEKALNVYGALMRLVKKYNLNGLTVRCFDLLDTVHTTSCAAFSLLNAQGIHSSCEGDVPALISMAIINELTGRPAFQANPSVIDSDNNTIVFAHCTLPFNMSDDIALDTHYESGIGIALKSEIQIGDATIFKTSGLLDNYFVSNATITKNLNKCDLCRTQIELQPERSVDYFLKDSIGNHHIIVNGKYANLIDTFFAAIKTAR